MHLNSSWCKQTIQIKRKIKQVHMVNKFIDFAYRFVVQFNH